MMVDAAVPIVPREPWHGDVLEALDREPSEQWRQLVRECSARESVTESGVRVRDRRSG